ncbi:MAG: hypothetical protein NTY86_19980 [Deltaproteobacteria bacterium]|nr:hypothetical protein [Deltaproteobacteria bacterium]
MTVVVFLLAPRRRWSSTFYVRKLDLPAAIPMGSESFDEFAIASGDQFAIGSVDVVLPHNGSCLVTCNVDVEAGSVISTGWVLLYTARRDVAAATNDWDDGMGMDVPMPSRYGSASATYTWSMTGGKTYRFGCDLSNSGDFIGKSAWANVSWVCR